MKRKILFLDSVHPVLQQELEQRGFRCDLQLILPRAEILKIIPEYFGVVLRSRITLDQEFLDCATSLRFIARSGSGLENIDSAYANKKGIEVFSSPEGNRDAVGEHVIGMLLMLMNHLGRADLEVRKGLWKREENRGHELSGKTFAIIGYGNMGSAVAEKLKGFGCRVIAYDKYRTGFGSAHVTEVRLDQIYQQSDIVSLHLPLSEKTHHYADERFFESFARPVYFINTSRGKHLKTRALLDALDSGRVLGACLDVLEFERPSLEGLETGADVKLLPRIYSRPDIVLSPHIAGWTIESYEKLSRVLAEKILAAFPE